MRFSALDGRSLAVWGVGRETRAFAAQAAARLPSARITTVILDDESQVVDGFEGARRVRPADAAAAGFDVLVRSPGVSIHRPEMRAIRKAGVTVTTATGLWLHERDGRRVIGVTGTKGKSTTATLIHHLSQQLRPTELAGNIGRAVIDLLDLPVDTWVVLELSSYQTSDLPIAPEVGVLTNLFREHIDWHGSEAQYRADKLALFTKPGMRAAAFHPGDPEVARSVAQVPRRVEFSVPDGWHLDADALSLQFGDHAPVSLDAFPLKGRHNRENLCAALAALEAASLQAPGLPGGFAGVAALPHRLQTVHLADGVEWVDDSISTTPESSLAALSAFPGRDVILIAGGSDRGQDHRALAAAVKARGATLITVPLTGVRLAADARIAGLDSTRLIEARDLVAAVAEARRRAAPGTVVLLSPAAPSYHAYANFEARGRHFAELARAQT